VEPTTRCNAWCPSCVRNQNGFGLNPNLKIEDLEVKRLNSVIQQLPKLEHVIFCGNQGDPCAAKNIDQQLDVVYKNKFYLQLQTNGSLRSKKWWQQLGKKFKGHSEVWFALDGLEDTHSYYRQGTNFKKIIDNATAFIKAGGHAIWQFIPFKHNEHQIKDCLKLSQQLGFKEFRLIKGARYKDKNYNYRTGKEIQIEPWTKHLEIWKRNRNGLLNTIQDPKYKKTKVEKNNCVHLAMPSIFLNAHGMLSPCCMLGIAETTKDISSYQINKNFVDKQWLPTCLKECGS